MAKNLKCVWQCFYILNNNCPQGKILCAPVTVQNYTKALLDQLRLPDIAAAKVNVVFASVVTVGSHL